LEAEEISISEWKAEKSTNLANSELKASYDGDSESFATFEEASQAL
jgi:hypothetical protein